MRLVFAICILYGCTTRVSEYAVSSETQKKEISSEFFNSYKSQNAPYVILVSFDGFRYDYAERFKAKELLSFDVRAKGLIPSFPTKTFPNHYTIVTGLYPGNHGLVSNTFYDRYIGRVYSIGNREEVENPQWYGGTPLWSLAREQEMVTASMMWVGTEAPINGHHPTYYYKYDGSISYEDRINTVINWLMLPEEKRPHFITLYFSETDDVGHEYGPDSEEIRQSVLKMDALIGDLRNKIVKTNLPVQLIVVSDHGMKSFDTENLIRLSELLPKGDDKAVITNSIPAMIYSEDSLFLEKCVQNLSQDYRLDMYKKEELPLQFHYGSKARIGDLVVVPKPGFQITDAEELPEGSSTHGYDPSVTPEMKGIFYADGPLFHSDLEIVAFENIHIYPLIAEILQLEFDRDYIDGRREVLTPILK